MNAKFNKFCSLERCLLEIAKLYINHRYFEGLIKLTFHEVITVNRLLQLKYEESMPYFFCKALIEQILDICIGNIATFSCQIVVGN